MKKSKVNQVENFEKLMVFCNTQSAVYKPSKASIQLAALSALLTQAQQSLRAADGARIAYQNAINARQPLFAGLPKLAARVIEALKAVDAPMETVKDAIAIKNKLTRAKRKLLPAPAGNGTAEPDKYRYGLSQLDFASKIENVEQLVNRVVAEALYKPNENDLKVASLAAFVQQLRTANRTVMNAQAALRNANRQLDVVLYQRAGVHNTAQLVKAYVRFMFGKGSAQDKDVSSLEFIKR
jgi:hypothetical protein